MKLKATHLIDEDVYLVENSGGLNLEVSGFKVDKRHFTVNSLDEIVWLKKPPAKIIHYRDDEGNTISVDGYNHEKKKLLENAECIGQYDDLEFYNLDEEYAYKKFIQTWKGVYDDPQEERNSVEIEVVEVRTNSGDPDIQSLWNSPNLNKDRKLYVFDRLIFARKCFLEYCEQYKVTPYIPSHTGLKYAKINNEYVFNSDYEFANSQFIGTLEQCKQAKEDLDQKIKKVVLVKVPKIAEVKISNIGSVLNQLYSVRTSMSSVLSIQKTRVSYDNALNTLRDVIKNLEAELVAAAERV